MTREQYEEKITKAIKEKINLIGRKFKIFVPTHIPSKGIKKWYKPTIKERRRIWLFSKFNVPYASDNEKASILRLTAITITIIIDIKKPPITFY